MTGTGGTQHLACGAMTIPDDLARRLRDARTELEQLDERRAELVTERDRLVLEAKASGGSLREIAELLGMSHMAVQHIVQRDSLEGL